MFKNTQRTNMLDPWCHEEKRSYKPPPLPSNAHASLSPLRFMLTLLWNVVRVTHWNRTAGWHVEVSFAVAEKQFFLFFLRLLVWMREAVWAGIVSSLSCGSVGRQVEASHTLYGSAFKQPLLHMRKTTPSSLGAPVCKRLPVYLPLTMSQSPPSVGGAHLAGLRLADESRNLGPGIDCLQSRMPVTSNALQASSTVTVPLWGSWVMS